MSRPTDPGDSPLRRAMRQRLTDRGVVRWAWAAISAVPVLGVPFLIWHGRRWRTAVPFLYGLTCQAIGAFALLTMAGALWLQPAALVLAAAVCFALGHRQGQEKAARDAATWLRLDG